MKTSIYYHEDDYGMKPLMPEENLHFIWQEFEQIIGYDIDHQEDINTTESYCLDFLKIKLIERKIPISTLETLCESYGFERIDKVYTGYASYRELDKNSKAFTLFDNEGKLKNFTLFYEVERSFISYLWVLDYFYRHESIPKLLKEIGKRWGVCLAENCGIVVNLKEEIFINRYFEKKDEYTFRR